MNRITSRLLTLLGLLTDLRWKVREFASPASTPGINIGSIGNLGALVTGGTVARGNFAAGSDAAIHQSSRRDRWRRRRRCPPLLPLLPRRLLSRLACARSRSAASASIAW